MEHWVKPKKNRHGVVLADIATAGWPTVHRDVNALRLGMIRYSVLELKEIPACSAPIITGIHLGPGEAEYLGVKARTMYELHLLGARKLCTPFFFEK